MLKNKMGICFVFVYFCMMTSGGCVLLEGSGAWQQPQARVSDIRLSELSMEQARMLVDVEVFNPNPYDIHLGELDYALELQQVKVLSGSMEESGRLPAGQSRKLTLPLVVEFREIAGLLVHGREMKTLDLAFTGGMGFEVPVVGKVRLPLNAASSIPVPQLPGIRVAGLTLEELSMGGAELSLRILLHNANDFALSLEYVTYGIVLNGKSAADGQVNKKVVWEAGEEKEIVLPMSFAFSRSSFALYETLLHGVDLHYHLSFESELASSLPALKRIPFTTRLQGRVGVSQ
ncbi:LEA type 2 family protein [Desulfobotulus sp. H1]|uniref:LEA type 2 family protein n=1 Tax=Desulfobotulus pelophilus TaxID=2823377 RepID=A0ABT3N9X8_9BACT|nr:LEA type 2 family protein [Desulfobotulus pelophilus]MCW7754266.1 LEA type 2 family protein [Desulfobotulus pelophilus]